MKTGICVRVLEEYYNTLFTRKMKFVLGAALAICMAALTPEIGSYLYSLCWRFPFGQYELIEELIKMLSCIAGGWVTILYTPIFALYEFFHYLQMFGEETMKDGVYWNFIIMRAVSMIDHMVYLTIQYLAYVKANRVSSRAEKWAYRIGGFNLAYLLHFGHNTLWGEWLAEHLFNIV